MASHRAGWSSVLFVVCIVVIMMPGRVAAFGAGNIPSIATVEGKNWRHGGEPLGRRGIGRKD